MLGPKTQEEKKITTNEMSDEDREEGWKCEKEELIYCIKGRANKS